MRFFEGFRCGYCERKVPAGSIAGECPSCSGPLLGVYDLTALRSSSTRDEFLSEGRGVWRFRHLLPAYSREVSLGEGGTPLVRADRIAREYEVGELFIKDEALNPTGSFKARGMAVALSRVLDHGYERACMPSAGNAGLALSAYSAICGIGAVVYMPRQTPEGVAAECRAYGAEVVEVEGLLPDAARRLSEDISDEKTALVSTFREPGRVEGKKTIAFEIEADPGGKSPDWILFPTGGGTGVVALWKAYLELEELGWLAGPRPRIAAVQSEGCAPVVRAFENGSDDLEHWEDPVTIASGIRVPGSRAGRLVLKAIRDTGGAAVAVSDSEIRDAVRKMASGAGIFPSPEGAAALAGFFRLVEEGTISTSDKVVVVNTAGWSRYRFLLDQFEPRG